MKAALGLLADFEASNVSCKDAFRLWLFLEFFSLVEKKNVRLIMNEFEIFMYVYKEKKNKYIEEWPQ